MSYVQVHSVCQSRPVIQRRINSLTLLTAYFSTQQATQELSLSYAVRLKEVTYLQGHRVPLDTSMAARGEGSSDGRGPSERMATLHSGYRSGNGHGGWTSAGVEQVAQVLAAKET